MAEPEISGVVIFNIVIFGVLLFFAGYVFGSTYKRPRVYRFPSTEWLKVSEHPIPEDIDRFIATDGEKISIEWEPKYNSKGKPIIGNEQREITEWQALPEAPRKKIERLFFLKNKDL
ncbi:MAG: hypothetical protein JSR85_09015 [Proteobacteria bacterium]|nr:hypothetical protein [Pseudomonadota bacterium]